jgi:Mandelate racemase / muconate lactonizing enzyme, N-terminal domain
MSDTYASMIATIKDVCGARLIGRSIFDVEGIHELFDVLTPANFMARAAVDVALYDAMGKATGQPVYNLIAGLCQERIPLEWSIGMASDPKKMVADAERALREFGIKVLCIKAGHPDGWRQDAKHFRMIRETAGEDGISADWQHWSRPPLSGWRNSPLDAMAEPPGRIRGTLLRRSAPDACRASATARLAGSVTAPGCSDEVIDPYVHLYAYGSYLGCLTANRWLGQG